MAAPSKCPPIVTTDVGHVTQLGNLGSRSTKAYRRFVRGLNCGIHTEPATPVIVTTTPPFFIHRAACSSAFETYYSEPLNQLCDCIVFS